MTWHVYIDVASLSSLAPHLDIFVIQHSFASSWKHLFKSSSRYLFNGSSRHKRRTLWPSYSYSAANISLASSFSL